MYKRFQTYRLLLTALLCSVLGLTSCSDEAGIAHEPATDRATVNLTFSTRANGNEGNMAANEGIKTLRIIVTDTEGTILYNRQETGLSDVERHTVSLSLPKTQVRFYVFANEESMGRSFDNTNLEADAANIMTDGKLDKNKFLTRAWEDTERKNFPKLASEITTNGLPMTGHLGVTDDNKDMYEDDGRPIDLTNVSVLQLEIPVVRCVIKLEVELTNEGSQPMDITAVNFGQFFPDKVYYFMNSSRTLPTGTNLINHTASVSPSITIPSKRTTTVCTLYTYPVSLPNMNETYQYSIALNNEEDYQVFLKKSTEEGGITRILRNRRLVIKGTISGKQIITWEDLNLVVCCWEDKEMEITFD